jgi:putative membrane protein
MVMKKSEKFFSPEEKQKIEQAISDVEKKSSGELVAMVVGQSSEYRDIDLLGSLIIAGCAAVWPAEQFFAHSADILAKIVPSLAWASSVPDEIRFVAGLAVFLLVGIIISFPVHFIFSRIPMLKRLFLHKHRMERELRERAFRAFHEKGLTGTREGTGILFMISLLERKVYVLADHGIYAKISQQQLDSFASGIGAGIAAGRGCDALCDAIHASGEVLAKHFPVKPDDINELSNSVISE